MLELISEASPAKTAFYKNYSFDEKKGHIFLGPEGAFL